MLIDIQSMFKDIIETPQQRRAAMQQEGEQRAQTAVGALSGAGRWAAPLVAQMERQQPERSAAMQRAFGGMLNAIPGIDRETRTESQQLQAVLSEAGTDIQALPARLRQMGYGDQALKVEEAIAEKTRVAANETFTQDNESRRTAVLEGNAAAALAETQAEQARVRAEREGNRDALLELINGAEGLTPTHVLALTSAATRNPDIPFSQMQSAIERFGGFPKDKESGSANLQFRTGEVVGEEDKGLQTFILNPDNAQISRTIKNPDGTITEELLPSNIVRFISSTRDAPVPSLEGARREAAPLQQSLFEVVGSAAGARNAITGMYNESPLADIFGTDETVALAQARFAGFENKVMSLYTTRSRPSNWSEQRILRLLPKIGTIAESEGSAVSKLVVLRTAIQDQYDYETQQYQATVANPQKQQEHYDTIQDLGMLLDDFGALPLDGDTLPVPVSRAEIEALASGTKFWLEGKVATWINGQIVIGQ